jgi:hypothetical protein
MRRTLAIVAVSVAIATTVAGCKKKSSDDNQGTVKRPKATPGKHILMPKHPPRPKKTITVEGLSTPESALYLAGPDVYLVSNINGKPAAVDGNGFVSRISPDGKVVALKWIDGAQKGVTLNAPKGMAVANGVLYVADINAVRMFDVATGAPKGQVTIEGATFLNDVAAAADGTVYVSDSGLDAELNPSGTDAIYAIEDGKARPLIRQRKDLDLGRPNGLLVVGKDLWVVTFGSGEIYKISADGKRSAVKKLPQGTLDGIAPGPRKQLLISSWAARAVYLGPPSGPWMEAVGGLKAPADISVDTKRKRVLVPQFEDNKLVIRDL